MVNKAIKVVRPKKSEIVRGYTTKRTHTTPKQNQKFPFHFFFRFAVEGWGDETREKCKEIFLVFAHASPPRIGSHSHVIGAYGEVQSHHALRACD